MQRKQVKNTFVQPQAYRLDIIYIIVEQAELYCINRFVPHEVTVWAAHCELQFCFMNTLDSQKKIMGNFSRQHRYFQFVSWKKKKKNWFWSIIVVISLAKQKILQNYIMSYFRKETITFLFWKKNFFFHFDQQSRVIHTGHIRNVQWKILEIPLVCFFLFIYWECWMVHNGW